MIVVCGLYGIYRLEISMENVAAAVFIARNFLAMFDLQSGCSEVITRMYSLKMTLTI